MPDHRIFLSSKYVTREPEKRQVLDALSTRRSGVFIFEGDRGVGKTSLLFSLFLTLNKKPDVKPFLVSLFPYEAPEMKDFENVWIDRDNPFAVKELNHLLQMVTAYWGIKDIPEAGDEMRKEYIARGLAAAQESATPVLIIDSIYECADDVRQALEEYLITPLISSGRGFIILSGRGKSPVWLRPELRQEQPSQLEKFERSQVIELLQKIESKHMDKADLIYKLSAGYPLLVRLLGAADQEPEDYLDDAINILIQETLPDEQDSDEYKETRKKLEKLAVIPTVFRPMEVENYLFEDEEPNRRKARTSAFVNTLLGRHIMKYKDGGYSINQSISEPLNEYLSLKPNQKVRKNYRTLLADNYQELAERFSDDHEEDAKNYYEGLKTSLFSERKFRD